MILLNDTNHLGLSRLKIISDRPIDCETIISQLPGKDLQDSLSTGRLPTGEWYLYVWWKDASEPKMTSYLSLSRDRIDKPDKRLTEYGFIPFIQRFAVVA